MSILIVTTERLELLAATPELMAREMRDLSDLSRLLPAHVPRGWPPKLIGNLIDSFVVQSLKDSPNLVGWSYWYWMLRGRTGDLHPRILIGRSHFSPPWPGGTVEIAYEVLEEFRGRGLGTEGVKALTEWAISHPQVRRVIADAYSAASVRVLEKSGFTKVAQNSTMARFETVCHACATQPRTDAILMDVRWTDPDQQKGSAARLKRWFRR